MTASIPIQSAPVSRLDKVNFDRPGFGDIFSDHMFQMEHSDGMWRDARVTPYGPFPIEPGALCLHYGQAVFEGLKAFMGEDGKVRIFRPDKNIERLRGSCQRLCIPQIDPDLFHEAIEALIRIDHAWIPRKRGQALYIRPLLIGSEAHLNVRPSNEYRFFIMTSPVREYFDKSSPTISLKAERTYTRAAPGGMGYAKTAGNYAASLLPGVESQQHGHDQVLWLDSQEHNYIEEVGQMNIFFKIGDKVVTPDLHGTILPGVTRASVIDLLRNRNVHCEERRISMDEIIQAANRGELVEAFGAGTAAVIAPVGRIQFDECEVVINNGQPGPLAGQLYEQILDIQCGAQKDLFGWNRVVDLLF